jgi:hypothetical protein
MRSSHIHTIAALKGLLFILEKEGNLQYATAWMNFEALGFVK